MRMIGTERDDAVGSICGSNVPPDTSFIISAPAFMAAFATAEWRVSIDIGTSETVCVCVMFMMDGEYMKWEKDFACVCVCRMIINV
mmetsp:Transcript_9128/g.13515  ORF Transcript_9128/g.13515 Transcript_9128/m.13515 type:complete len:86 (+) Transcript_9128:489-746(+)